MHAAIQHGVHICHCTSLILYALCVYHAISFMLVYLQYFKLDLRTEKLY